MKNTAIDEVQLEHKIKVQYLFDRDIVIQNYLQGIFKRLMERSFKRNLNYLFILTSNPKKVFIQSIFRLFELGKNFVVGTDCPFTSKMKKRYFEEKNEIDFKINLWKQSPKSRGGLHLTTNLCVL
jgi:hypothetical protein